MLCPTCSTEFFTKNTRKIYCCRTCKTKAVDKRKNKKCTLCSTPCRRKFCSIKCAARYNHPTKEYLCKSCNVIISIGWTGKILCDTCKYTDNPNYVNWNKVSIKDLRNRLKNKYQYHARIRSQARTLYKRHNPITQCEKCSYDKHTQVCHIKPIADFDPNTPIAIVNDIKNLCQLCPNCHWEFDNL